MTSNDGQDRLEPCGCGRAGDGGVGGYVYERLHGLGIHDPVLAERLAEEAREEALWRADDIIRAACAERGIEINDEDDPS